MIRLLEFTVDSISMELKALECVPIVDRIHWVYHNVAGNLYVSRIERSANNFYLTFLINSLSSVFNDACRQ